MTNPARTFTLLPPEAGDNPCASQWKELAHYNYVCGEPQLRIRSKHYCDEAEEIVIKTTYLMGTVEHCVDLLVKAGWILLVGEAEQVA